MSVKNRTFVGHYKFPVAEQKKNTIFKKFSSPNFWHENFNKNMKKYFNIWTILQKINQNWQWIFSMRKWASKTGHLFISDLGLVGKKSIASGHILTIHPEMNLWRLSLPLFWQNIGRRHWLPIVGMKQSDPTDRLNDAPANQKKAGKSRKEAVAPPHWRMAPHLHTESHWIIMNPPGHINRPIGSRLITWTFFYWGGGWSSANNKQLELININKNMAIPWMLESISWCA